VNLRRTVPALLITAAAGTLAAVLLPRAGGTAAQAPTVKAAGRQAGGVVVTPSEQTLTPAGAQAELYDLRPQVLAMSPDGRLLITSGKTNDLVVLDPATGQVRQKVPMPGGGGEAVPAPVAPQILKPDKSAQVSYTGLAFSPDGSRIYLSDVNGSIKVFAVGADGAVAGAATFALSPANAPNRKPEIPAGLVVSPNGQRLYAALNLSNRLVEMDAATGAELRHFDVGALPYAVVLCGGKAYVSNWGGRRPDAASVVGPAGRGTTVRVLLPIAKGG